MLSVRDAVTLSVQSLMAHRLRSALTLLGIMMGMATLILVITIIQGANFYVEDKIINLGSNVFIISKTPPGAHNIDEYLKARKYKDLTLDDMRDLQENCSACGPISTQISRGGKVKVGAEILTDVRIRGVTASHIFNTSAKVEDGRYISLFDERQSAPVCVIGDDIAEQLYPGLDPIGKLLRVDNRECRIIGRMERIGSVLGQNQDTFVLLPVSTFLKAYGSRRSVTFYVQSRDAAGFGPAQDEVRMRLRVRRHRSYRQADDFYIATSETFLSLWESISSAFFIAFIFIASIASIVGGIVIMNIMLVSVTERTREIGIRRALGARRADIRRQLLVETLIQCILGGFLGVSFGFCVALLVRYTTPFPAAIQTWVVLLGIFLSTTIGLVFGLYPARRAADLEPVEAIRME